MIETILMEYSEIKTTLKTNFAYIVHLLRMFDTNARESLHAIWLLPYTTERFRLFFECCSELCNLTRLYMSNEALWTQNKEALLLHSSQ